MINQQKNKHPLSVINYPSSINQYLKLLKKRNGKTRTNSSPAFRSNLFVPLRSIKRISTAIGAKLSTSLLRNINLSPIGFNPMPIIYFLLLCCLWACENDMNEVNRLTKNNQPQFDYAEEVEILYSEDGIVKAKVNAPELIKDTSGKPFTEFPKGIRVEILNAAKEPISLLTANYGKRYDKSEETLVQNDVVVTNKNGETLETEELTRNDKTGELYTDAFVTITTKTEVLYGMGLKANEDFSTYRIDSVQGIFNVNQSKFFLD